MRTPGQGMTVSDAILSRHSVRAYLDRPVDGGLLRDILTKAARAPSGCNLQPWKFHVVAGAEIERLKRVMCERVVAMPAGEPTDYDILPVDLPAHFKARQVEVGFGLYEKLGIAREDRAGRFAWHAHNLQFFDAPVGLFCSIDRRLGPPQWADMGMVLQNVMLLLREVGLDSCPQEAWSLYPQTVGEFIDLSPDYMLFCGMAIGYADPDHAANSFISPRAPLEDYASFVGI